MTDAQKIMSELFGDLLKSTKPKPEKAPDCCGQSMQRCKYNGKYFWACDKCPRSFKEKTQ